MWEFFVEIYTGSSYKTTKFWFCFVFVDLLCQLVSLELWLYQITWNVSIYMHKLGNFIQIRVVLFCVELQFQTIKLKNWSYNALLFIVLTQSSIAQPLQEAIF